MIRRRSQRAKGATLEVIAKRVGVSKSAVSLALNNRGRLSDEVREQILSVAEEVGYQHKRKKRDRLKGQVRLGVLLDRRFFWPNESFFTRIVRGVEEEAVNRGYHVMFTTLAEEQLSLSRGLPFADTSALSGLIVVGITHPEFLNHLNSFNAPTVLVACGRYYDHRHDVVLHDDFEGMEQIFEHLRDLGHRRIGFIGGGLEHLSGTDRLRGYKIYMDEMMGGFEPGWVELVEGETSQPAGEDACARLLAREARLTALICATDEMAAGAIRILHGHGLSVPRDISVIGFDNKPLAELLTPPLTTVQISCEEMGRVATELLAMRTSGLSVAHALRVFIGSELIKRSSTARTGR